MIYALDETFASLIFPVVRIRNLTNLVSIRLPLLGTLRSKPDLRAFK